MEQLLAHGLDPNTRIPGERLQRTPLFIAVVEDQLEAAKALLDAGADPKIEDENGDPVMVYASDHDKDAFARLLIEHGISVDSRNRRGITPLLRGAGYEEAPDVRAKLALGADPDLTDRDGNTALMIAADAGNLDAIKVLTGSGASLDLRNREGKTALMQLFDRYDDDTNQNLDAARALLDAGASVDVRDHSGRSTLMVAIDDRGTDSAVIDLLLDANPDIHIRDKDGRTALFYAVRRGNIDNCVNTLLERGADPKVTDKHGIDLLMLAAYDADNALIQRLIGLGLSPVPKTGQSVSAVHRAAGRRLFAYPPPSKNETAAFHQATIKTLRLLRSKGASLTDPVSGGDTPLHSAAATGSLPVIKFLLPHFPDPDLRDANGATPLRIAADLGRFEITECLLAAGASINTVDKHGRTALLAAVEDEDTDRIHMLHDLGADFTGLPDPDRHLLHFARRFHDEALEPGDYASMIRLFANYVADINACDEDGMTALMWAAASNNRNALAAILDKGPDLDARSPDGRTALMWAASARAAGSLTTLKAAGADDSLQDSSGKTAEDWLAWAKDESRQPDITSTGTPAPLDKIIANSRRDALNNYLAGNGWNPADRIAGTSPLHIAASMNATDAIGLLLERGAHIDLRDDLRSTPLITAAANGRGRAARLLLDRGADIAAKDSNHERAIDLAVSLDHPETARLLLDHGGALGDNEAELLVTATRSGNTTMLRELLAAGASVPQPGSDDHERKADPFDNRRDWRNNTPLSAAARMDDSEMLRIMHQFPNLSGASDPDQLSTAAQHAAVGGRLENLRFLVETMGANPDVLESDSIGGVTRIAIGDPDEEAAPDQKPVEGYSPLSRALEEGHHAIVRYLVSRGVTITGRTRGGQPPLTFTVDHGQHALLKLFLEHHAPTELVDLMRQTALHHAAESDDTTAIRLLLKHGANPLAEDKKGRTPLDLARKSQSEDATGLLESKTR